MAYAAVISVKQIIQRLLDSSEIPIGCSSRAIIESAHESLNSLQEALERFDYSSSITIIGVDALDGQLIEAVHKLEDVVESFHFHGDGDDGCSALIDEINSFTETVKKTEEEYIKVLDNPQEDASNYSGNMSKMVGFSDERSNLEDMFQRSWSPYLEVISIFGMAGIGKTTLAKELFQDPSTVNQFDFRVWVAVGRATELPDIMKVIVAQLDPDRNEILLTEEDTYEYIQKTLNAKRYLVVLDDIWEEHHKDGLMYMFDDHKNGSRVLLTTRRSEVANAYSPNGLDLVCYKRLLDAEESWHLLCEKVFAGESCPPQLEKAGKRIAENCDGLPLAIVTVANLLSEAEKTPEYWNEAAEKQNPIFRDAYDKVSEVLLPNYYYLPQYLKACFLYMGVFPQNYEIPRSKLIKLWSAEGFLEPYPSQTVEQFALGCFEQLASRSLVMTCQMSSDCGIKTFRLHSAFWHMCIREAGKNKFFQVLNNYADGVVQGVTSNRRLSIPNNILFAIKDVLVNSIPSISTVRSLLCTGPHHQYPVPICSGLRLLRVLDALTICFYMFPMEVVKLVHLRYLALTYNGDLPASISQLRKLEYLIVHRHLTSIKSRGGWSYMPMEIWEMKALKHLQVIGRNLPANPCCGVLLPNLSTLVGVSIQCCTKGYFRRFPNLKKLGIRIEVSPNDDGKSLGRLNRIWRLRKLESLKCVVVNPQHIIEEVVTLPAPRSMFPSNLKKLTLSGLGYPWEHMSLIGILPNLEVLKLQRYAFQGSTWETSYGEFPALKYLVIENSDLMFWTFQCKFCMMLLRRLSIRHCYELLGVPWDLGLVLVEIELVDSNPIAVASAKQIQDKQMKNAFRFGMRLDMYARYSWEDEDEEELMPYIAGNLVQQSFYDTLNKGAERLLHRVRAIKAEEELNNI